CRLNNSANIDQDIGLAVLGKGVAMNTHTRCHSQFSFHTCWLQFDRVIAYLCRFIFLTRGVRCSSGLADKGRDADVAVSPATACAAHMRVTEADNRMVTIVAVIGMWEKGVWSQAYQAQRQVGA